MSFFSIPAGSPPNINFFNIITVPPAGSSQNFFSVSDIKIDPTSIPRDGDVLDADGVVTLRAHFYVDTKSVSDNNINEIKFSVFSEDPTVVIPSVRIFSPGSSRPDPLTPISSNASLSVVRPIRTLTIFINENKKQTYDIIANTDETVSNTDRGFRSLRSIGRVGETGESSSITVDQGMPISSNSTLDSERNILRRVLNSSHLDPTDYINWRYFSTIEKTLATRSGLVFLDKGNEFTKINYISLSSKNRQRGMSQQNPDSFTKNSDISSLYKSSVVTLGNKPPSTLRRLIITSRLREYEILFNIRMSDIKARSLKSLYLRSEIIDSGRNIRARNQNSINFFQEIQGYLTPAIPASIKVQSDSTSGNIISISQNDIVASTVTLYRMIINPRQPRERQTRWQRLVELPLSTGGGEIKYNDASAVSVPDPGFIVYEAVCSGPAGSKCPVSKKIISAGRRRNAGSQRASRAQTRCAITAYQDQENNQIFIRVADIPLDVSRIVLRRQLMSTSIRQNDSKYHDVIKTVSGDKFYRTGSEILDYQFIDKNVYDRAVYRYYVEFDSISGIRTESSSEEVIQFRVPPQKKIVSSISSTRFPTPQNLTTSFQLNARFKSEGLKGLNDILTNQGVADLFKADLRTDRSQISKLLVYEVSRKNTRTGDRIIWPIINSGEFTDNELTRSIIGKQNDSLVPGDTYVYTANLLMIDPESLFTSSTTSIVSADGLRRIQISAKKFAENYSVEPGKMVSPTTFSRSLSRESSVSSFFTGISHTITVKAPGNYSDLTDVRASRSTRGIPANIIRWSVTEGNDKEKIYCFRIDIVTNKNTATPLMTVSPNSSLDGASYEIRDEINANMPNPVQYIVSTIKADMTRGAGIITEEIPGISSYPEEIIRKLASSP